MTTAHYSMFQRLNHIVKSPNRIEAFDFVRTMAALSIILTHFKIIETYGIGVDAFFVLSGFLVVKLLSRDMSAVNQRYFIGRFTKIIPSYFFFLIIAYLAGSLFFDEIYGTDLPILSEWKQYFFFYRNYGGLPNRWAFEHVWALCVEEHFYLMLLFLSILSGLRSSFRKAVLFFSLAMIVFCVAAKTQAQFTSFAEYPTYTHNRLDAFGYGALIYLFMDQIKRIAIFHHFFVASLSAILLLAMTQLDQSEHQLWLRTASPVLLSVILIYLMQFKFSKIFRILAYYSYNAYLWHYFILIPIVFYWGYTWVGFVVYLGLTVVLAFLATHLVEDFFINRRDQIFKLVFKNKAV
ncbi:acyltransferase [Reichenbachiella agarivorans]|uniref:Acyltransferase n=1 Tax=Reichenbachiella agarivorans TaxID=2979464 RepID=A0ABY6CV97_9BACT|nr:acyltransferase [Reichenbachiella agarivorans]UXP33313.1 acyltransferase [Reichenbachiella agarivorans]